MVDEAIQLYTVRDIARYCGRYNSNYISQVLTMLGKEPFGVTQYGTRLYREEILEEMRVIMLGRQERQRLTRSGFSRRSRSLKKLKRSVKGGVADEVKEEAVDQASPAAPGVKKAIPIKVVK